MYKDRLEELRIAEEIKLQYKEHERSRTLRLGRLTSFLAITGISLFLLQDTLILGHYDFIPWRIMGLVPFIIFLFFSFTIFRRYPALIIPMHSISIAGLVSMMCGILASLLMADNYSNAELYPFATGFIVVLFAVLIFSAGAMKYLPVIIFMPLLISCITLLFTCYPALSDWAVLSNPVLVAAVVSIYSVYQTRFDFRKFRSKKMALLDRSRIAIQHNIMSTMINAINESALLIKPEGTIVYTNETLASRYGIPFETITGMNVFDILPENLRQSRRAAADMCIETKKSVRFTDERLGRSIDNTIYPVIDDNGKVVYLAILGVDITERMRSENEIKRLLEEKKLLLKEVHHRIKNNMLSISGLLTLRSETAADAGASAILKEMSSRVITMMKIYERLYRSEDYTHMQIREYITGLVSEISRTFLYGNKVSITCDIEDLRISQQPVFAIGIIVNELVINALKYAFPDGRSGNIQVSLKKTGDKNIGIIIHDNGAGMHYDDAQAPGQGFGLDLVKIMVDQCGGTMDVTGDSGTTFTITIPDA